MTVNRWPSAAPDRSTFCGLAAILLWSTTIALARSLSEQLGAYTAAASVYLIGGLFCLVGRWRSRRLLTPLPRFPRPYLFGCGALFVFYAFALFQAIGLAADRRQVLEVGMLNYLWPALTILFSLAILRKQARFLLLPGTALALAGEFLVLSQDTELSWSAFLEHLDSNPLAYALALLAAISWGLYSTLTRRWASPHTGGAVPFFMLATGVVLLVLRLLLPEASAWNLQAVLEILFLGLATALAYSGWDLAMRRGNVVLVAACSYFTPLLSTLVSCLYLGIAADPRLWLGGSALVAGSLLSWRSVIDRSPATATQL